MKDIIVATIKDWNIKNFNSLKIELKNKYNTHLITKKEDLIYDKIKNIDPIYIFFPHWSWIIPKEIYSNFECIVFHMTNLPYGRGGSPLQNLIIREIYDTKISAIRVEEGLDTGDIYLKKKFDISCGSAEQIYQQISKLIFEDMIPYILKNNPTPKKQTGNIVEFKRRKPNQSDIYKLNNPSIKKLYDFIRMLDAQGYPKAYINLENITIKFSEAHIENDKLIGKFEVTKNE